MKTELICTLRFLDRLDRLSIGQVSRLLSARLQCSPVPSV